MNETVIIQKDGVSKLKNPVLLTGLPGIGLIGQVVGRYLVEELKAPKIANIFSPHFPHQVFMTKKGGMRLIRNSIYLYRGKKRDIVILIGDVQAMSSVGQYEVAGKIVEYAAKIGIREILTVGGYSTGDFHEKPRIFAVATSEELRARLRKQGIIFGEAKGSIVGAAGLLPVVGKLHGIPSACIMGETHGGYVDAVAARNIVKMLSKYLSIPVDLTRLDERVAENKKIIKKVEQDIQKTLSAQFEQTSKNVSYIR